MGVTRSTAMEIAGNTLDLHFSIPEKNGKFGFVLARGPGHNFKVMLSGPMILGSREEVVAMLKEEVFEPVDSYIRSNDLHSGLTPELAEKICADLLANESARTY